METESHFSAILYWKRLGLDNFFCVGYNLQRNLILLTFAFCKVGYFSTQFYLEVVILKKGILKTLAVVAGLFALSIATPVFAEEKRETLRPVWRAPVLNILIDDLGSLPVYPRNGCDPAQVHCEFMAKVEVNNLQLDLLGLPVGNLDVKCLGSQSWLTLRPDLIEWGHGWVSVPAFNDAPHLHEPVPVCRKVRVRYEDLVPVKARSRR